MKKKETIPLTTEESQTYQEQKACHTRKKEFNTDDENENIIKSEIIVIILENIEKLLTIF